MTIKMISKVVNPYSLLTSVLGPRSADTGTREGVGPEALLLCDKASSLFQKLMVWASLGSCFQLSGSLCC